MAEYIERTEELMLAMNAGARAIENTRRYHGAVYIKDLCSESPQEIPYLLAAKVLREESDAPAADAAPVVHGRWVLHYTAIGAPYTECSRCCTDIAAPMVGGGLLKLDMREMPYCPICGAQMDGGEAT